MSENIINKIAIGLAIIAVISQLVFMYAHKYDKKVLGFDKECWKSCGIFILILAICVRIFV